MAFKLSSSFVDKIMVGVGSGANESRKIMQGSNVVYSKTTVSFDSQGGSSVSSKEVYYGQTYGTLASPTKTNYTFAGWFDASSGGNQITSGTTVTTSNPTQTLYAHWNASAPAQPSVSIFNITATSISFYVTNNSSFAVTIYYENWDSTPDLYSFSLGAGATSSLITYSGLTANTDYYLYVCASANGLSSTNYEYEYTTLKAVTTNPSFGTPYKTTSWRVPTINNDASTVSLWENYSTNPPTTLRTSTLGAGATYTYNTGLTIGGVTVYAKAQASGKNVSGVSSVYI